AWRRSLVFWWRRLLFSAMQEELSSQYPHRRHRERGPSHWRMGPNASIYRTCSNQDRQHDAVQQLAAALGPQVPSPLSETRTSQFHFHLLRRLATPDLSQLVFGGFVRHDLSPTVKSARQNVL